MPKHVVQYPPADFLVDLQSGLFPGLLRLKRGKETEEDWLVRVKAQHYSFERRDVVDYLDCSFPVADKMLHEARDLIERTYPGPRKGKNGNIVYWRLRDSQ